MIGFNQSLKLLPPRLDLSICVHRISWEWSPQKRETTREKKMKNNKLQPYSEVWERNKRNRIKGMQSARYKARRDSMRENQHRTLRFKRCTTKGSAKRMWTLSALRKVERGVWFGAGLIQSKIWRREVKVLNTTLSIKHQTAWVLLECYVPIRELIDGYAVEFTITFKSVFVINTRNDCY